MTEALLATDEQRRRSVTLALLCVAAATVGLCGRAAPAGSPPAPCPRPGLVGVVLVCDGRGAAPGARAWLAGARVDVNAARARELEAIPGVGPVLAGAIIDTRNARGGFSSWADLDEVPGIGPKTLGKLEAYLRVAPPE